MNRPTQDEIQAVYDLIIATCEHSAEFEARGAEALRTINRLVDAPASAGSPKGRDAVGGSIGVADNIAVGAADAPKSLLSHPMTYTQTLEARARLSQALEPDPEHWAKPSSVTVRAEDLRAVLASLLPITSLEAEMIERLRIEYEMAKWAHDWSFDIVPPGKPANKLACDAIRALPLLFKIAIRSLSASPTDAGVEGWQEIASAPKDGTIIDLWGAGERVSDAKWISEGWKEWGLNEIDAMGWVAITEKVTHWCPLPSPPLPMVKEEGSTGTANACGTALSSASPIEPQASRPKASIAFRGGDA